MKTGLRLPILFVALALFSTSGALAQGTKPAPKTAKPPAKAAPAAKKPEPPPPPAPPSDVRYKTTYVNADQTTESTTYIRDGRERYELGDTILIKQHDQKKIVQIDRASNTYLVTAEGAAPATPATSDAAAAKPPGVVNVNVSIIDMGERKDAFNQKARRVRTLIVRQPMPGACDQ